jgi:hypothetical protein
MRQRDHDRQAKESYVFASRGIWFVTSSRRIQLAAGMVDVDPDQIAFGVVIQNHAFGDFLALHARSLREIDVKRIGIWKIIEFHGLNLRSKNALCMVSLSERVMTRKKRPPSSSTLPQNDNGRSLVVLHEWASEGLGCTFPWSGTVACA